MKKEYLKRVLKMLNKRAERALKKEEYAAYVAYTSAIDIIEYAAREDAAGLAQFDY